VQGMLAVAITGIRQMRDSVPVSIHFTLGSFPNTSVLPSDGATLLWFLFLFYGDDDMRTPF
jgi:hypothetical protein